MEPTTSDREAAVHAAAFAGRCWDAYADENGRLSASSRAHFLARHPSRDAYVAQAAGEAILCRVAPQPHVPEQVHVILADVPGLGTVAVQAQSEDYSRTYDTVRDEEEQGGAPRWTFRDEVPLMTLAELETVASQ